MEEYNLALQNRFECLDSKVDLENMWSNFRDTVTEISIEVLGKRPRRMEEQHLSQQTKDLLMKHGQCKHRDPTSDSNRSEYSKLNKLAKKSSKVDDNNWVVRVATDLEEAASKGQQREVWAKIKISGNGKKKQPTSVRDIDGKKLSQTLTTRETGGRSTLLNS